MNETSRLMKSRYVLTKLVSGKHCVIGANLEYKVAIATLDLMRELFPLSSFTLENETEHAIVSTQELERLRVILQTQVFLNSKVD